MIKIKPSELVPMDIFIGIEPIKIDIVYAQKNHPRNIFKTKIYHENARLWAHKDIAAITLLTARKLYKTHNYTLEIQDCLRTINAQKLLGKTDIIKTNPEWSEGEGRFLAPPGKGSHPRGMAIDVRLITKNNNEVDMGTQFDHMDETSARNYTGFSNKILNNRKTLENSFMESAKKLNFPFLQLPSEWWDFRFPPDYANKYYALSDADLPPQMQMTQQITNNIPDFDQEHFDKLASTILNVVDENF